MTKIQTARPPWSDVVFVCRKCARKSGRKKFAKELKADLKRGGHGKTVRVVETDCLDPCPKRRLTIASRADLAVGRVTVVPPDIEIEAVTRHITVDAEAHSQGSTGSLLQRLTYARSQPGGADAATLKPPTGTD